jgi:two-component system chemotaxis response regulator CheB
MLAIARTLIHPARVMALAIGSSTGGPEALCEIFPHFRTCLRVPVFVTQHMPPGFTVILAEHLKKFAGCPCTEAEDGEIARAGHVYIAPGGHHLLVEGSRTEPVLRISDGPQENYCRPSIDPMFRSLAKLYGPELLAVILTGMGQDGRDGARAIVAESGTVLVQDQPSSAAADMPSAIVRAGLASEVLPLKKMGREIAGRLVGLPH